jgi:hypothetical protein
METGTESDKLVRVKEVRAQLREFTKLTGGLHEYQVQHLKMWPLVFFGYNESECHFDYEAKELTFFLAKNQENLAKRIMAVRFKEFVKAIKELIGDYKVIVRTNKKVLYES